MSFLRRFQDLFGRDEAGAAGPDSLAEIEAQLDRLGPEQARYIAAFAFVLARVAHADLKVEDDEVAEIRRRVAALAALQDEEASALAELVRRLARRLGGTDNYTVTREFRRMATPDQRLQLLECLFAVAAADGSISTAESGEISNVAEELGFTRPEANAIRVRWKTHLAELQGLEASR